MKSYIAITFIISGLVIFGTPAQGESQNIFEPKKMSSEPIVTFVLSCKNSIMEKQKIYTELFAIMYCSCSADAHRSGRVPDEPEIARICAENTRSRITNKK